MDVVCLDLSKAFEPFLQHSPGEAGCSWLGQVYCLLGAEELTEWPSPERAGGWSYIQLGAIHT